MGCRGCFDSKRGDVASLETKGGKIFVLAVHRILANVRKDKGERKKIKRGGREDGEGGGKGGFTGEGKGKEGDIGKIWNRLKPYMLVTSMPSSLDQIIDFLEPLFNKKSARSIIIKLVSAASCYLIWKECNDRLFSQKKLSSDQGWLWGVSYVLKWFFPIDVIGRIRALEQETRDLDVENKQMKVLKASYGVTTPHDSTIKNLEEKVVRLAHALAVRKVKQDTPVKSGIPTPDSSNPVWQECSMKLEPPRQTPIHKVETFAEKVKKRIIENQINEEKLLKKLEIMLQNELPPKEKDPGSFVLPCIIGNTTVGNALIDLGESDEVTLKAFGGYTRDLD
ncbi:hypothetical protein Tco_1136009 [Tanacetum coccineum]